jgi:hypothetical protein
VPSKISVGLLKEGYIGFGSRSGDQMVCILIRLGEHSILYMYINLFGSRRTLIIQIVSAGPRTLLILILWHSLEYQAVRF